MHPFLELILLWVIGGIVFGVPLWLAWWLSDGFVGYHRIDGASLSAQPGYNPYESHPGTILVNDDTGAPVTFPQ